MIKQPILKTSLFTAMALIAFAANSVLCRLALGVHQMDAGSFTVIRLLSGIIVLYIIVAMHAKQQRTQLHFKLTTNWLAAAMLFVYATAFSFAYISLDTATGALILFGSVQITMIAYSIYTGNRLNIAEWIGLAMAFIGFTYLIYPNLNSPSAIGFLLMSISGIAWGIYSIQGMHAKTALFDTAQNFIKTLPFIAILALISLPQAQFNLQGTLLALLSGGIASGIGYAIWYTALRGLSNSQAAVIQLAVPVIAAIGGVLLVSEEMTLHLMISTVMVLGGILIVISARSFIQLK
ncbi:MAG: DMT family transporter [Mariprofundaceae bacterium]|nr:DMT family transporter [Mariprofundaceae bacterium]